MAPWGEADQRQLMIREALALELGVEEGVEQRRHRLDPEQQRLRPPVAQREPLTAERRHVAGLGCVRCDERRIRQPFRERRREPDQIVAVGAHAVKQDDQLARRAAGAGRHPGSGQESHGRRKTAAPILSIAAPATIIAALYRSPVFLCYRWLRHAQGPRLSAAARAR
jgi:hypothetical protein